MRRTGVSACPSWGERLTDLQDPADREFVQHGDYSGYAPDPSIGAVLCGFDAYVSK